MPETDHLSLPPDFSCASNLSDEEWQLGGSECDSHCPGTNVSNRADENDVAPILSDLGGSSDLQENADCTCDQGPDANDTDPADKNAIT